MAEQTRAPTPNQSTVTVVESEEELVQQDVRSVRLKLRKPKSKKQVQWCSGTVDNEHLNKKKSKCCCQYEKPRAFDESSSSSEEEEEEEECEHCFGHVEKKKKHKDSGKGRQEHIEHVIPSEVEEQPVPESNSSDPEVSPGNPEQSPSN